MAVSRAEILATLWPPPESSRVTNACLDELRLATAQRTPQESVGLVLVRYLGRAWPPPCVWRAYLKILERADR